jgi:DNA-binding CsgD family transcriptional regulator
MLTSAAAFLAWPACDLQLAERGASEVHSDMHSDTEQLEDKNHRRFVDRPDWADICATLENTVLVFERVTEFVSTSPWASHTSSIFESRTQEAQARLAHLRAAVTSLEQSRPTLTIDRPVIDATTPSDASVGGGVANALEVGAASSQTGPSKSATQPSLTAREREVAILIAKGRSNRQIADALVLVPGTVANHVAHILGKLGCANRAQVAAWAVRNGLLKDESFG